MNQCRYQHIHFLVSFKNLRKGGFGVGLGGGGGGGGGGGNELMLLGREERIVFFNEDPDLDPAFLINADPDL